MTKKALKQKKHEMVLKKQNELKEKEMKADQKSLEAVSKLIWNVQQTYLRKQWYLQSPTPGSIVTLTNSRTTSTWIKSLFAIAQFSLIRNSA